MIETTTRTKSLLYVTNLVNTISKKATRYFKEDDKSPEVKIHLIFTTGIPRNVPQQDIRVRLSGDTNEKLKSIEDVFQDVIKEEKLEFTTFTVDETEKHGDMQCFVVNIFI